jgi:hypothetical protein
MTEDRRGGWFSRSREHLCMQDVAGKADIVPDEPEGWDRHRADPSANAHQRRIGRQVSGAVPRHDDPAAVPRAQHPCP